jgi:hypothetical protein
MKAASLFVGACLLAAGLPAFSLLAGHRADRQASAAVASASPAMADVALRMLATTSLRDRPLTQQPLTALEARFARRFPGAIARFRAGDTTLIVREVDAPTRQLHPAADCFRAAGFAIGPARPHENARGERWNCFEARQDGRSQRVCERIADAAGRQWTDVSSWYWAALWSQRDGHAGPWWATTFVTPLEEEDPT